MSTEKISKRIPVSVRARANNRSGPPSSNNSSKRTEGSSRRLKSKKKDKYKSSCRSVKKKKSVDCASVSSKKFRSVQKKASLAIGGIFEGAIPYEIVKVVRNPGPHGEFLVKAKEVDYQLRLEPTGRSKLAFAFAILKKVSQGEGKKLFPEPVEYGNNSSFRSNFMITSVIGLNLEEVRKVLQNEMSADCVLNVGFQTLEAIKYLHRAGFVNRNIKPATFNVTGVDKSQVVLADFRITRIHLDDKKNNGQPMEARKSVAWLGTQRYAAIAAMKEKDQGRKDDLESWIYMIYDLYDPENGLPWKKLAKEQVLELKESFRAHKICEVYIKVPEILKRAVDLVASYSYESAPDYDGLKSILNEVVDKLFLDRTRVDWRDRLTPEAEENAICQAKEKSVDNKCSGKDDFVQKKPKKVAVERKKMKPNDQLRNGNNIWKVVVLLGSGGFGDVYKVFNEKGKKDKFYALKTESEDGSKMMLRLKVEMQVMTAIQEARKNTHSTMKNQQSLKHFVEFVDRGKSENLKCKFIVMSLVGPSLDDIRKKFKVDLSEKNTPYVIAIQSLEAVRDLHSLGFLHRDIKPANFAVGVGPEEPTVFMLDFGICRSFLDPTTSKHRAPRKTVKFLGTLRYASRACMKTTDQGRKDDLECWIYMIFDLLDPTDGIPWKNCRKREKILKYKTRFFELKIESVFLEVSSKLKVLLRYIDCLEYQSLPDYSYIENHLIKTCEAQGFSVNKKVNWLGKLKQLPRDDRFDDSSSNSLQASGSEND